MPRSPSRWTSRSATGASAGASSSPTTAHPIPIDEVDARLDRDALVVAVEHLPDRERLIVESRLGLGRHRRTLEDLGHELGLTRERVRQLETRALRRLGGQMAASGGADGKRAI